jgi:hypothetical protein
MADLRTEVWVNQLTKNFYPDTSFLKYAKDFSQLVENHAINMTDVGVDPDVLINNSTYPISVVDREDTPLRIELDKFETENTLVRSPEVIEYSYNKLESVIMGHRNVLRARTAEKAAHAYAPSANTDFTPLITTTGGTVNGRKRLAVEDILLLKERYDRVDIPYENRYLVLHPSHLNDLILIDLKSFKDIADIRDGLPQRLAGFNILQFSKPANYVFSTLTKKSFSAVPAAGDTFCSFSFHSEEVMKADGNVKMYQVKDDPKERATIVGFEKRFIAVPIRNKGLGAIVSTLDD